MGRERTPISIPDAHKIVLVVATTEEKFRKIVADCREVFVKKTKDYGTAWRILRPSSLTDQILIKAKRIRSIQEKGVAKVDEGVEGEFMAIINYCLMALMQLDLTEDDGVDLPLERVEKLYDKYAQATLDLLLAKNHDYGEAWRDMRVTSITDIILMKLHRTRQIEENEGKTLISEGVDANYQDMLNYSVFALILMGEGKE